MNESPPPSPADTLERRAKRLNFWVVWGFAAFDVMLALFQPIRAADKIVMLLGIAAVTCQVSLLTIWVALAQTNLRERLPMVAPAYGLAAWFLGDLDFRDSFGSAALALLLLFLFNAIIPYALLRLLGVRCLPTLHAVNRQTLDRRRGPMQFSLAALFKMTFVAACATGVIRLLTPQVDLLVGETILLGLSSVFGLGGIWSILTQRAFLPRAVLFVVLSICAGIALDRMIATLTHGGAIPGIVSIWAAIHLAAMLGVLLLYRMIGYRVVRGELCRADGAT